MRTPYNVSAPREPRFLCGERKDPHVCLGQDLMHKTSGRAKCVRLARIVFNIAAATFIVAAYFGAALMFVAGW
jgi:hypothetical protein